MAHRRSDIPKHNHISGGEHKKKHGVFLLVAKK